MRLFDISTLVEMAGPAQTCGTCGASPIHKTHTYKKDANGNALWQCRGAAVAAFKAAGGNPQPAADGKYYFTQAAAGTKPTSTPAPATKPAAPAPAGPLATIAQSIKPQAAPAPAALEPEDDTPPAPTPAAATRPATHEPARPTTVSMKEQIEMWLRDKRIDGATVAADMSVSVDEDVLLASYRAKHGELPVKFSTIKGDFVVGAGLITSFNNFPSRVDGDLHVSSVPIVSLEGCTPSIGEDMVLDGMSKLTSLETSTPIEVGGNVVIEAPKLTSLKSIHKYIKRIDGTITIKSKVESNLLGLLSIKGVTQINLHSDNRKAADILNKQIQSGDKDIHAAQDELMDAGMEELANL